MRDLVYDLRPIAAGQAGAAALCVEHTAREIAKGVSRLQEIAPGRARGVGWRSNLSVSVCPSANALHYPGGGGHLWAYLNWALGLRALGCERKVVSRVLERALT